MTVIYDFSADSLAGEPVPEFGLPGKFGPDHLHRDQPAPW